MAEKIKVGSRTIALSNVDKIFFPKSKITKGNLIEYYSEVAACMAYHVKNHPLTMQRFPNGIAGESFYQKNVGEYFPSWIKTIAIEHEQGKTKYAVAHDPATFAYLANQGCITVHAWLSKIDKLRMPDRVIFDLDPSGTNFNWVREGALLINDILKSMKIPCYAMTTGSRGIHIMIPLKRVHTFDEVADFAYAVAQKMIQEDPKRYTLELRKEKRGNKVFIDTLRNRWSATSVVPYSVRPKEKAPVATPLWWDEVYDAKLSPQQFNIKNVLKRLDNEGDAWKDVYKKAISLKRVKL